MIFPPAPARDQTPLAASRALHGRLQEVHEEVWKPLLARAGGESDHAEDRSGPALQPHFLPKARPHVALMRSGQGCARLNRQRDWPGQGHTSRTAGDKGSTSQMLQPGAFAHYGLFSCGCCCLHAASPDRCLWKPGFRQMSLCAGEHPGLGHVPSTSSLDYGLQSWAFTCTSKTSSHIRLLSYIKPLRG